MKEGRVRAKFRVRARVRVKIRVRPSPWPFFSIRDSNGEGKPLKGGGGYG